MQTIVPNRLLGLPQFFELMLTTLKKLSYIKYTYSMANLKSSRLELIMWRLGLNQAPLHIVAPPKWEGRFDSINVSTLNWSAKGFNSIKPGESVSGFSFQSPHPPIPIAYYATGETDIPAAPPTATDDEPTPDCPGWFLDIPRPSSELTGMTLGPADPDTVAGKIKIKSVRYDDKEHRKHDCDDRDEPDVISGANGKIKVILVGDRDFDVSKVEVASLLFGRGQARPISTKILKDHDDRGKGKKTAQQDLLLEFNLKDINILCEIDRALFLRGKVGAKKFVAATAVKPNICKAKTSKS